MAVNGAGTFLAGCLHLSRGRRISGFYLQKRCIVYSHPKISAVPKIGHLHTGQAAILASSRFMGVLSSRCALVFCILPR